MAATSSEPASEPPEPIGSVANALRVLLMFRERPAVRVHEVSAELGVARSTGHRLLAMLTHFGLAEQDPRSREYRLGPALAELRLAAARREDILVTVLHPFLSELSGALNETAHVILLEGANCRFIDSIEADNALRTTARAGYVYPAHANSGGKALLAQLDDDELRRLYPDRSLPPLNERTNTSRAKLFEELDAIRSRGYATNFGESELGIVAVAIALQTRTGDVPAAMAVSAPEARMPDSRIPAVAETLRPIAERAARRLP